MFYVRTEQRPGRDQPEHLFVCTRERVCFERWHSEVPPEFELVIDTDGRRQANETRWLLQAADHDKQILVELLTQACEWLPRERAEELRQRWTERQP